MKKEEAKLHLLSERKRVAVLLDLFEEFYSSFKKNDFIQMHKIANVCNQKIEGYFSAEHLNQICERSESLDMIVDILCFVYPTMFMYDKEVEMLTKIAESQSANIKIRCRALDALFAPELEVYIKDKKPYYMQLENSLITDLQ